MHEGHRRHVYAPLMERQTLLHGDFPWNSSECLPLAFDPFITTENLITDSRVLLLEPASSQSLYTR